jgi:uncharacterized protein YrrD
MTMQIKQDTKVLTADGKDIGHVDRVVMDPATREITHLVVRQGWLFTEDKVLPFGWIDRADENEIRLRPDSTNLDDLPPFEETHYVPEREADPALPQQPVSEVRPYFHYPYGVGVPGALYPDPGYVSQTQRNVPPDTVALKEGARVIASDGSHVGDVAQIISHAETGRATHFVISKGLLLKAHKLIPNQWIRDVMEDEVRLAVSADVVNRLRDYEPARS